jgi:MYXO-CTERM domain-containing protein
MRKEMKGYKLSNWIRTVALAGSLIMMPLAMSASAQTNSTDMSNTNTARTTTQTQNRENNDHDWGWLGLLGLAGLLGLLPKKRHVVHDEYQRDRDVNRK